MRALAVAVVVAAACGGGKGPPSERDRLRQAVLDTHGHVIVMKNAGDFAEHRDVVAAALAIDPGVLDALPFVMTEAQVEGGGTPHGVLLKGVDLTRTPLGARIVQGALPAAPALPPPPGARPSAGSGAARSTAAALDPAPDDFPDDRDWTDPMEQIAPATPPVEVAMGAALGKTLGVVLGAELDLVMPPPFDPDAWGGPPAPPRRRTVRVVGFFTTGVGELDDRIVVTTLSGGQELIGTGDQVLGVELRLRQPDDAARVAKALGARLGAPYTVMDWCELNRLALGC